MKHFLLSLLICLASLLSKAQTLSWSRDFSAGSGTNSVQFTKMDKAGNTFYAGNYARSFISEGKEYQLGLFNSMGTFLVKVNPAGQQEWVQAMRGGKEIRGLTTDEQGNVIITCAVDGDTMRFDDDYYHVVPWGKKLRGDALVIKFNANGVRQWVKGTAKPPDRVDGDQTYPYGVMTDPVGNVYNFGVYYYSMCVDSTAIYGELYRPNQYIVKFSPEGKVIWLKKMPATGVFYSNGMMDDGLLFYIYREGLNKIVKYDFNGNITLDREFKRDSTKGPSTLTTSGKYIYVAALLFDRKDWNNGFNKMLITKLDASANMIWEIGFRKSNPDNLDEYVPQVSQLSVDKNENLYILGAGPHYWGYPYELGEFTDFGPHRIMVGDEFIARLNPEGRLEWLQKFPRLTKPAIISMDVLNNGKLSIGGLLKEGETKILTASYNRGMGDRNQSITAVLDMSSLPIIPLSNQALFPKKQEYTLVRPMRLSVSGAMSSVDASRFTIKNVTSQGGKGTLAVENNNLWFTPVQNKTGLDTIKLDVCNTAGTACQPAQIIVNIKDSLKALKEYAMVNPGTGHKVNLFEIIHNPNEGYLQLEEEGLRLPIKGESKFFEDGTFLYTAGNALGKDTLGLRITSYDPRLENDIPVSLYLNYVLDIRSDVITGIPGIPSGGRPERIHFSPNPVTAETRAAIERDGCNQLTVQLIDLSGKAQTVPFELNAGSVVLKRGSLAAGYYIVVIRSCKKVYVDKLFLL